LPNALSDSIGDLADLIQKELRLAKAEIAEKVSNKFRGAIWIAAAGILGFLAAILAVQAAVFAIASYGIPVHWSCLIVSGVFACLAALAFLTGRANAAEDVTPTRTVQNVKQDIATAKEQLT
jgi:hypothetical protein